VGAVISAERMLHGLRMGVVPGCAAHLVLGVVRRVRPGMGGRVVPGFKDIPFPVLAHTRGAMGAGGFLPAIGYSLCCHVQ